MVRRLFIMLPVISCLLTSCFTHSARRWRKNHIVPASSSYHIAVHQGTSAPVNVLYTGCGGLVISRGSEAFMTDPYYTGHHFWNMFWKKMNPKFNKRVLDSVDNFVPPKQITGVLIAHSHYDHLEDLPYLLHNKLLSDSVKVLGDQSTLCTVRTFTKGAEALMDAEAYSYKQHPKPWQEIRWFYPSPHIRVLPIEAAHAPHVWKIHAMQGNTCSKGFRHFSKPESRTSAFKWKEGHTYSYLVDVLNEQGEPALRIFIQSSSCQAPFGFPPASLLAQKPVDVAFLGVASAQNAKRYPEDILDYVRPQKVVLIHWEDFFMKLYRKRNRSVRGTNMRRFMRHLRKQYNVYNTCQLKEWVSMPQPLTRIIIDY